MMHTTRILFGTFFLNDNDDGGGGDDDDDVVFRRFVLSFLRNRAIKQTFSNSFDVDAVVGGDDGSGRRRRHRRCCCFCCYRLYSTFPDHYNFYLIPNYKVEFIIYAFYKRTTDKRDKRKMRSNLYIIWHWAN